MTRLIDPRFRATGTHRSHERARNDSPPQASSYDVCPTARFRDRPYSPAPGLQGVATRWAAVPAVEGALPPGTATTTPGGNPNPPGVVLCLYPERRRERSLHRRAPSNAPAGSAPHREPASRCASHDDGSRSRASAMRRASTPRPVGLHRPRFVAHDQRSAGQFPAVMRRAGANSVVPSRRDRRRTLAASRDRGDLGPMAHAGWRWCGICAHGVRPSPHRGRRRARRQTDPRKRTVSRLSGRLPSSGARRRVAARGRPGPWPRQPQRALQ